MKTYIKNNIKAVKEYLAGLSNSDLVNTWNENAREHDSDNEIYNNDEDFFQTFFDGKLMEAIRSISYGDYNYSHEYVKFDGYANLQSFNDPSTHIDLTELAESIMDHPIDFYDIELEEEEETEDTKE